MSKDLIVQKIDIDRTIGGKEVQEKYTQGRRSGIPVFFILESDGSVVVDSFGPDGNVGSPYHDNEIEYFAEMMKKAAVNITSADIEKLVKLLVEARESDK